ncbi:uncharacterized protein BP5553_07799 [Venustampulla echinocandica]|uniref:Dienelactone hydrolase domain-containing protein n=1 Tax=Venustampulla echinocandica TaxID=2656787 RepID=A0A370THJ5_9HELO|nr:uncharacterized protein BP5553_07799 [Venustampulla echinocandica]RDL34671.1 hypothetical protein BP5553_07799 [Venustampulla echinocandica]
MTCDACNTIPPVTSGEYTPKGSYVTVGGLKTYITGPSTSSIGLVGIYDVFGLAPQTLQGADLLSTALNALILVPDFLEGDVAKESWFTGATEEGDTAKAAFMAKAVDMDRWTRELAEVARDAKSKWEGVGSWGAYGLCWGGKVVVLSSGSNSPFKASGQVHPGRLDAADALIVKIPHIVLASNGEDAGMIASYAETLVGEGKPHVVETYADMHHGWMGARANLANERNLKEYERGYNQLAAFFAKHL